MPQSRMAAPTTGGSMEPLCDLVPTQKEFRGSTVKDFVQKVIKEGRAPRVQEHSAMMTESVVIYAFTRNPEKNVFSNIPLLDASRVPLEKMTEADTSDYIHASYLKTPVRPYIMTQEVMPTTAYDMWRMTWQEGTNVIVCLQTGDKDDTPFAYWKTKKGASAKFSTGNAFKIRTLDVKEHRLCEKNMPPIDEKTRKKNAKKGIVSPPPEYVVYTLKVNHDKMDRVVYVMHYKQWLNDVSLPNMEAILDMMELSWKLGRSEHAQQKGQPKPTGHEPIIVQCDSGVKRAGTYVLVDSVCRAITEHGKADVIKSSLRVRKRRYGALQQRTHYAFVYNCMFEHAMRTNVLSKDNGDLKQFQLDLKEMPADTEYKTVRSVYTTN